MLRTARIIRGAGVAIAALVTLSACSTATDWLQGRSAANTQQPVVLGAPEAEVYLQELADLAAGDPAKQAEIFADANAAATLTPGPTTELRLALVLATPGHPESDAERAQSMLREVLARPELLTGAEIDLARIYLNGIERLVVASAEARRLREASSRAARTEEQAIAQRLATVEAENRRLRQELQEAAEKLDAITSIERSIREQE